MKYLFIALLLQGCGIQKAMDNISSQMQTVGGSIDSVSASMKETNEGIKYTKDSIRRQTLALAVKELTAPENTTFVSPSSTTPTSMIPSGKLFAEVATPEEICGLFYIWITEINQGQADEKDGGDRAKWIKLTGLQVIAGFISPEKIEEIIKTQKDGRYAESVINILLIRYVFIATYILDLGLLAKQKINQAEYEFGIGAIKILNEIESMEGAKSYSLKLYGFVDHDGLGLNQTIKLDGPTADEYLKKLNGVPK